MVNEGSGGRMGVAFAQPFRRLGSAVADPGSVVGFGRHTADQGRGRHYSHGSGGAPPLLPRRWHSSHFPSPGQGCPVPAKMSAGPCCADMISGTDSRLCVPTRLAVRRAAHGPRVFDGADGPSASAPVSCDIQLAIWPTPRSRGRSGRRRDRHTARAADQHDRATDTLSGALTRH